MSTTSPPPLTGIRVLELAGLAPGPYAGMLLADYGASVLRIDRPNASGSSDQLTRRKAAIAIDLKQAGGRDALLALAAHADVLIDPYRPGVLETLGLGPDVLRKHNPRLIVARMTGFRRDGKYSAMAGHDINYLAVSGVLSQLGRKGEPPYAPGNILGDFAGGGLVLFTGIVMALLHRSTTGIGQVVEANMVDGVAHLGSFPRFATETAMWDRPRGENVLDGGCPWYDTYETKDGQYMAVGALEPQFFAALIQGLALEKDWNQRRYDRNNWPDLRAEMQSRFRTRSRLEWEHIFDGTDACCTPVLSLSELRGSGHDQRALVTLRKSPSLALGTEQPSAAAVPDPRNGGVGSAWTGLTLKADEVGEKVLHAWTGWVRGKDYSLADGAILVDRSKAKL